MVNKECVTLYNLDKDTVQARVSEVVQQYRGDCEYRELEQTTQVKTKIYDSKVYCNTVQLTNIKLDILILGSSTTFSLI